MNAAPSTDLLQAQLERTRQRMAEQADLSEACLHRFRHLSLAELVERVENAPDFGYDDEAVALSMRLLGRAQVWGWDGDRVRIYDVGQEVKA